MRIAGYIEHPILKITIFQMENRYSVKLETPQFEQTYKFLKGPLTETVADIKGLIDDTFIEQVLINMQSMSAIQQATLKRSAKKDKEAEDEFEDIL